MGALYTIKRPSGANLPHPLAGLSIVSDPSVIETIPIPGEDGRSMVASKDFRSGDQEDVEIADLLFCRLETYWPVLTDAVENACSDCNVVEARSTNPR
jgi:hypothetical protein